MLRLMRVSKSLRYLPFGSLVLTALGCSKYVIPSHLKVQECIALAQYALQWIDECALNAMPYVVPCEFNFVSRVSDEE
jgi:hypothetical protein